MGMCMSFILLMFLLPVLQLITGSNSITSSTGLGYLRKCPDGYNGNPCLDNGCKDDGECVQGTTPGSIHGFNPQGMEGTACINCGCNPKSKLMIGFAGGLITLLFTSASFLIYKGNKKLKENELNKRHAEQLNELKERYAEQLNELKKRHAEQLNELRERHAEQQNELKKSHAEQLNELRERHAELQNELKKSHAEQLHQLKKSHAKHLNELNKRHAWQMQNEITRRNDEQSWVSIGQSMFSWLTTNESLLHSILDGLEYYIPSATGFCSLLRAIYATVQRQRQRRSITLPNERAGGD